MAKPIIASLPSPDIDRNSGSLSRSSFIADFRKSRDAAEAILAISRKDSDEMYEYQYDHGNSLENHNSADMTFERDERKLYYPSSLIGSTRELGDEKLNEQFRFYRQECIEAALAAGVTVPLDILESRNNDFTAFVDHRGPRYLLSIMHSYSDSIHLQRVGSA